MKTPYWDALTPFTGQTLGILKPEADATVTGNSVRRRFHRRDAER